METADRLLQKPEEIRVAWGEYLELLNGSWEGEDEENIERGKTEAVDKLQNEIESALKSMKVNVTGPDEVSVELTH